MNPVCVCVIQCVLVCMFCSLNLTNDENLLAVISPQTKAAEQREFLTFQITLSQTSR